MSKAPAFQFYPGNFLSDPNQMLMELDEVGAYIRLICVCWDKGNLPDDARKLAKLCGTTLEDMHRIWPAISPCFQPDPSFAGHLIHPRLEKERAKQAAWKEKSREGGRRSATKRQEMAKGGSTVVEECLPNGVNQNPTLQASAVTSVGFSASAVTPFPENPCAGEPQPEPEPDPAEWMHAEWEKVLGRGRPVDLTSSRRAKYRALYREQLKSSQDPVLALQAILLAVVRSDHHMSKREYQMPESIFRNEDRRSTWVEKARAMPAEDASEKRRRTVLELADYLKRNSV